jgi:ribosomal protein S12 methylthiotransferase accessory factor
MSVHSPDQLRRATAAELGDEALDLDRLARCAPDEPGMATGGVSVPRKDARIRWVRGYSLVQQRPLYVPAIMVYLFFPAEHVGENFWIPISTGCAFHHDLSQAVLSGLLEVIERDSLALTWLHQLPLPRLDLGERARWPAALAALLDLMEDAALEYHFFDATTDLGVPTVYALQLNDHTDLLANLVVSASRLDPWEALTRTVEEGCSSRLALDARLGIEPLDPRYRRHPELIYELEDCALYYAERDRRAEFRFLLDGRRSRALRDLADLSRGDPSRDLARLLDVFRARGMEVVVVDLTTPEVRDAGFWAIRVIVPEAVPMSPVHAVRFLDTPRLYEAPRAMGFGARARSDVTAKPQPFA